MSRLTCLLATAGAMLLSSGAHAGEIYEIANVSAVEHENSPSYTWNTHLTAVHVGQTQPFTLTVQVVAARCVQYIDTMLEHPGTYRLRLDIEWDYSSTGVPYNQYVRSCKLTRL